MTGGPSSFDGSKEPQGAVTHRELSCFVSAGSTDSHELDDNAHKLNGSGVRSVKNFRTYFGTCQYVVRPRGK